MGIVLPVAIVSGILASIALGVAFCKITAKTINDIIRDITFTPEDFIDDDPKENDKDVKDK